MKTLLCLLLLLPVLVFAEGPEPAPWWQRVEETQVLLTKWITTLTLLATGLVTAVFAIWALVRQKLAALEDRQDRQSERMNEAEKKITHVALAAPPPSAPPAAPSADPGTPPNVRLGLFLFGALMLSGCAMTPETKAKWSATGSFLARRAAALTTELVLNAAINAADRDRKEDFAHSFAQGLRSIESKAVTGDDVRALVGIWTPEKPHWRELGENLAIALENERPKDKAAAVEAIAQGVETAAAK